MRWPILRDIWARVFNSSRQSRRRNGWLLLAGVLLWVLSLPAPHAAQSDGRAALLSIDGAIGPATSDYVHRNLTKARENGARVVVLRMDTPGGLDTAMRDIIQDLIAAPLPVLCYVAPSGARAASAGTYIIYACHVAAMAPGTNLGAATPVRISFPGMPAKPGGIPEEPSGKDEKEKDDEKPAPHPGGDAMERKIINDASAYLRSLAQMRGRNVEWTSEAVREGASLPAKDALAKGVIDLMATDLDELLAKTDGREVMMGDIKVTLKTAGLKVDEMLPDWRNKFLAVITNPNVAYLLMIVGLYGLVLEFYNPGATLPGVVGAISLLLALYAFQALPVNYAGLALIILGIALMVVEAMMPSFGILGLGGTAALVIGSIFLIDTEVPGFGISWQVIAGIAASSLFVFTFVVSMALKSRTRPVVSGAPAMIGSEGEVINWSGGTGTVLVMGERWEANANSDFRAGEKIRVVGVTGLVLKVETSGKGVTRHVGN